LEDLLPDMLNNPTGEEIDNLLREVSINLELEGLIGKGGQKHVYKAVDVENGNSVVFKVLTSNTDTLERVKREIYAVDVIGHQYIPRIIETNADTVTSSGQLIWIVEEFISGKCLRDILSEGKTFTLEEVVSFIDLMFEILEKSASHNIIHRDIKPENIILDLEGNYWLIDFGISRHLDLDSITLTHAPFGLFTIGYSAAEQFRNRKKEIDIRADLFSVGVVATEMIQGYNPYLHKATDILEVIKRIEQQPLPALRIQGDDRFLMAKFIKLLGDNRLSRRPKSVEEAKQIFELVKETLTY